jgi:hypothetical protein
MLYAISRGDKVRAGDVEITCHQIQIWAANIIVQPYLKFS